MRVPFNGGIALVVEDDWFVREDIANQFRQEGWTVLARIMHGEVASIA